MQSTQTQITVNLKKAENESCFQACTLVAICTEAGSACGRVLVKPLRFVEMGNSAASEFLSAASETSLNSGKLLILDKI